MGPLQSIAGMLPGMSAVREADLDSGAITRVIAIIDSMTAGERANPHVLNGSRKRRVARGSGQSVPEINRLLKQFAQMRRMMKQYGALAAQGRLKGLSKLRGALKGMGGPDGPGEAMEE